LKRGTCSSGEFLAILALLAGCATPLRSGDRGENDAPDLSRPLPNWDLAGGGLQNELNDLSLRPDLFTGGGGSPDLKPPVTSDLASTPPDLFGVDLAGTVSNAADLCANAPVLPIGIDMPNQDTTNLVDHYDFGNAPSTACTPAFDGFGYDGHDGAYRVTIPAGKKLTVVMTKSNIPTNWDPALAIVTDCASAGPTCLSGSDEILGLTETVSYTNTGASALPVFILVDSFLPSEYGVYSIRADLN
jgi:hypothetical protein